MENANTHKHITVVYYRSSPVEHVLLMYQHCSRYAHSCFFYSLLALTPTNCVHLVNE